MEILYGYCHCGCGQKTRVRTHNDTANRYVKGQPMRFINGHGSRVDIEKRFWDKVIKHDGCWEWIGAKCSKGYGNIRYNKKIESAHRLSWRLNIGEIPNGLHVLHKCDNPECTNPSHLFLGTNAENVKDRDKKGRYVKMVGESNGLSKLTNEQVREIRSLAGIKTVRILGEMFKINPVTAHNIIKRKTWKHI